MVRVAPPRVVLAFAVPLSWRKPAMESMGISDQQLAEAAAAGGASSSHALAAEAAEMEASVERFLDEAMIEEFKATPLHTLESVLEERKDIEERRARIRSRSEQLMQEELAKQRHEKEVQELQDAIKERGAEDAVAAKAKPGATGRRAATPEPDSVELAAALLGVELTGAGRSKNLKPYVYDHTEFVSTADSSWHPCRKRGRHGRRGRPKRLAGRGWPEPGAAWARAGSECSLPFSWPRRLTFDLRPARQRAQVGERDAAPLPAGFAHAGCVRVVSTSEHDVLTAAVSYYS